MLLLLLSSRPWRARTSLLRLLVRQCTVLTTNAFNATTLGFLQEQTLLQLSSAAAQCSLHRKCKRTSPERVHVGRDQAAMAPFTAHSTTHDRHKPRKRSRHGQTHSAHTTQRDHRCCCQVWPLLLIRSPMPSRHGVLCTLLGADACP
jgi:hypothetical protein